MEKTLDGPVFIYQNSGRCVVPLRFFADVLPFRIQVSASAGIGIFDDQANPNPAQ